MGFLRVLLRRNWISLSQQTIRHRSIAAQAKPTTNKVSDDDTTDEPLKFFGSNAATWKARTGFSGGADEALWYQPYVVSASLAVFLIYFCMLREESDIDRKFDRKLIDHVEGMEEVQLNVLRKYNLEYGKPTEEIDNRLTQIELEKLRAN